MGPRDWAKRVYGLGREGGTVKGSKIHKDIETPNVSIREGMGDFPREVSDFVMVFDLVAKWVDAREKVILGRYARRVLTNSKEVVRSGNNTSNIKNIG